MAAPFRNLGQRYSSRLCSSLQHVRRDRGDVDAGMSAWRAGTREFGGVFDPDEAVRAWHTPLHLFETPPNIVGGMIVDSSPGLAARSRSWWISLCDYSSSCCIFGPRLPQRMLARTFHTTTRIHAFKFESCGLGLGGNEARAEHRAVTCLDVIHSLL